MKSTINENVKFLCAIDRMETLPRTGFFYAGIPHPESVAAHSYGVAVIAMLLVDQLEMTIDKERVLRMAIIHDMTEALLTDIPSVIFKYLDKDQKIFAERKTAEVLLKPINDVYLSLWEEFEQAETVESKIIKCADKLQLCVKILNYTQDKRGNFRSLWVDDAVEQNWWGIEPAQEMYDAMLKQFQQLTG